MREAVAPIEHELVELSVEIVSAYVAHNALSPTDLPKLIADVYAALSGLGTPDAVEIVETQKPAVSIRKSITPDFIICLEDGKQFKSLKRHLRTTYNMSPEEYRSKWNLPSDYPMVAPDYSARRSALAKTNGLGRKPAEPARKPGKAARAA